MKIRMPAASRAPCITTAAVFGVLAMAGPAWAQVCAVPGDFDTVAAAVSDPNCDEIQVGPGDWPEEIYTSRDVTITGAGIGQTTLEATSGTLLGVTNDATAILRGLSLKGMYDTQWVGVGVSVSSGRVGIIDTSIQYFATGVIAGPGAQLIEMSDCNISYNERGVFTEGRDAGLLMDDCVVSHNSPLGGLVLQQGKISDSTIEQNFNVRQGGGIRIAASATLDNVTVRNNHSGEIGEAYADGGGIFLLGIPDEYGASGVHEVVIRDSLIENNFANRYGGGVAVHACNIQGCQDELPYFARLHMTNTTVRHNRVTDMGGGVSVRGFARIEDSIIEGNASIRDQSVYANGFGDGGGLGVHNAEAIVERTAIRNNFASYNGGGVVVGIGAGGELRLINSTVAENRTDGNGGGVMSRGELYVLNSTIASNEADLDQDDSGDGGGLYRSPGAYPQILSSIVAANYDRSPTQKRGNCAGGSVVSSGGNLFGWGFAAHCSVTLSPSASPAPDTIGARPRFAKLRWENDTYVVPIRANSPAVDAGFCDVFPPLLVTDVLDVDQRRLPRKRGVCDSGAYEIQ